MNRCAFRTDARPSRHGKGEEGESSYRSPSNRGTDGGDVVRLLIAGIGVEGTDDGTNAAEVVGDRVDHDVDVRVDVTGETT